MRAARSRRRSIPLKSRGSLVGGWCAVVAAISPPLPQPGLLRGLWHTSVSPYSEKLLSRCAGADRGCRSGRVVDGRGAAPFRGRLHGGREARVDVGLSQGSSRDDPYGGDLPTVGPGSSGLGCVAAAGRQPVRLRGGDAARCGLPASWDARRRQPVEPDPRADLFAGAVRAVLRKWDQDDGADVRFSTKVVGFAQDDDGVTAEIVTHGEPVSVRAQYIVR